MNKRDKIILSGQIVVLYLIMIFAIYVVLWCSGDLGELWWLLPLSCVGVPLLVFALFGMGALAYYLDGCPTVID